MVVTKIALYHFPPFFYAFLRFALALPFIILTVRPSLPWLSLSHISLLPNVIPFLCLTLAMNIGTSPTMVALCMQCSPFLIMLSPSANARSTHLKQLFGGMFGIVGLFIITWEYDKSFSLEGILLALTAAFAWGKGNVLLKRVVSNNSFALLIWSAAFSAIPLFALCFVFERPLIFTALQNLSLSGLGCLIYTSWISLIGGGILWMYAMQWHNATRIISYSLLIPFFSALFTPFLTDESLSIRLVFGGGIICLALALTQNRHEIFPLKRWRHKASQFFYSTKFTKI